MPKRNRTAHHKHTDGTAGRSWHTSIRVCDHHGVILDFVTTDQAQRMFATQEYIPTGTKKYIDTLVHKGPPDQREVEDKHALSASGSRKPHYLQRFYSGARAWALKGQARPWGQ